MALILLFSKTCLVLAIEVENEVVAPTLRGQVPSNEHVRSLTLNMHAGTQPRMHTLTHSVVRNPGHMHAMFTLGR